jgi:hypothetical protein
VVWLENRFLRVAVAPDAGGAIFYLGEKGQDAQHGIACAAGDSLCREQWISNRGESWPLPIDKDRGRQLQFDLRDQTHFEKHPVTGMLCGGVDLTTFRFSGCGWNPTQAGSDYPERTGETGGTFQIPASRDKLYVRTEPLLNFEYVTPPQPGDTAPQRTDVWSEQWYCLNQKKLTMQVRLHHEGSDDHWNFGVPGAGPGSELAGLAVHGGADGLIYGKNDKRMTVRDPQDLDANARFIDDADGWFAIVRKGRPDALRIGVTIPPQPERSDFGKAQVAYWGTNGIPDRQYPMAEATILQQLNLHPHAVYEWSVDAEFFPNK